MSKFSPAARYAVVNTVFNRAEGAFTGTAAAPGPEISDFPRLYNYRQI